MGRNDEKSGKTVDHVIVGWGDYGWPWERTKRQRNEIQSYSNDWRSTMRGKFNCRHNRSTEPWNPMTIDREKETVYPGAYCEIHTIDRGSMWSTKQDLNSYGQPWRAVVHRGRAGLVIYCEGNTVGRWYKKISRKVSNVCLRRRYTHNHLCNLIMSQRYIKWENTWHDRKHQQKINVKHKRIMIMGRI